VVLNGLLGLLAVTAVLAAVSIYQLVAGSDDDVVSQPPTATSTGPTAATRSTSSAPSTSSASQTLKPPPLPAAAAEPTRAGAEAFLRYFFEVYNYSYDSLDSRQMQRISLSGCKYCAAVVRDVRSAVADGLRYRDGLVSVTAVVAAPGDVKKGLIVSSTLVQTGGTVLTTDGQVWETSAPVPLVRVDALVIWSGSAWQMRGVDVLEGATS
jgi:hypothetical protein